MGGSHADPVPPQLLLLILYRFGVLLAVGARANAAFPHMPLADAYESALAQRLAVSR